MLEIVIKEVLWSIRGAYQTIWSFPLTNVKWHSVTWPWFLCIHCILLSLYHHGLREINKLKLKLKIDHIQWQSPTDQTLYGCGMSIEDAYSYGHLVLSHFGTCMRSNVETNLSWTCLVSGPLNFEHPSVLLYCLIPNSTFYRILSGFHRTFATGVACLEGTLTPPDTWSRPLGTSICSTCCDQPFSELVVIFTGLCSSNIPRYFLDFA